MAQPTTQPASPAEADDVTTLDVLLAAINNPPELRANGVGEATVTARNAEGSTTWIVEVVAPGN